MYKKVQWTKYLCPAPQKDNSYVETITNVMVFRGETLKGLKISALIKKPFRDFPGSPGVKNPPFNTEDTGSIPGQGTKIPHAMGRPSSQTTTREAVC